MAALFIYLACGLWTTIWLLFIEAKGTDISPGIGDVIRITLCWPLVIWWFYEDWRDTKHES